MLCGFFFLAVSGRFIHPFLSGVPAYLDDVFYILLTAAILYVLVRRGVRAFLAKESELQESEDRLARILETNASGIVVFDGEGKISYVNNAAIRILGGERSQMIGFRYDDPSWGLTEADGSPLRHDLNPVALVQVGRVPVYDVELGAMRRDGSRVFLTVNAAPLLDASGKMVGIVASFGDITERKKAEDLKVRKLHLAMEQSPSAIVITDLDGNEEYANPRYASLGGCTAKEILRGDTPHQCMMPAWKLEEMRAAVRSGNAWRGEFHCLRCHRKEGTGYWESTSVTPVHVAEGETANLLWVREDITDRKEAEEALRRSEANYRAVVEDQTELICRFRSDGILSFVNQAYCRYFGKARGELVGTPFPYPGEGKYFLEVAHRRASPDRDHPPTEYESRVTTPGGEVRWQQWTERAVFDAAGTFVEFQAVGSDVTEHRQADIALHESEERFRQLFEQNEEPIFLFRHGTPEILDANPAAVDLYGYSRQELLREGLALFVPPRNREKFSSAIAAIRSYAPLSVAKESHLRKDGEEVIVSIRAKSIRTKDGLVAFCSIRDITARTLMEREAKMQQAQLIHANRMASLGAIVSGVAHEVNNPNNLIMFNAPMILSVLEDALPVLDRYRRENGDFPLGGLPYSEMRDVVPKLAAGISDASMRIKAIVANLKDFARQDEPRGHKPERINDAVRSAVGILNHELMKGTHDFRVDFGEDLPPVMGSGQQLEQVVINLLHNALQSLPSSRQAIRVSTLRNSDTGDVEVHVVDEGIGMPREVLERITEPFYSTRLDSGGLGLGLSICQSIVKGHGGTLRFESEVGKGTRATVRLPALKSPQGDGADSPDLRVPAGR